MAKTTTTTAKKTATPAKAATVTTLKTAAPAKAAPAQVAPATVEPTQVAPAGADLTYLDPKAGPYVAHIDLGSTTAVAEALSLAKVLDVGVVRIFANGKEVRVIDYAAVKSARKAARSTGRGAGRPKSEGPSLMVRKAIELAMRPQGVTREELKTVSPKGQPWTQIIKKAAESYGYTYATQDATPAQGGRVAYRLTKAAEAVTTPAAAKPQATPVAAEAAAPVAVKRPARKVAKKAVRKAKR
jgi:hypothetical protein